MVDKIIKALPEKTFTEKMDESELLELKDSIETVDKIKKKLNSTYISIQPTHFFRIITYSFGDQQYTEVLTQV